MNKQIIIDVVEATAELAIRNPIVKKKEENSLQSALAALKQREREKARQWFDVSLAWNQMHEFVDDWKKRLNDSGKLTYVVDSWFLQDLIGYLTPGADEEISYVTGVSFGRVRILSRLQGVRLEKQSVVYARATAKSCTDALVEILDRGNHLHVMAHSHPGNGASATHESSIDVNYLGKIQRADADVIGIIVTRDGFVRFFSVDKPFQVWVQGSGVTQINENIFKIELSKND